MFTVLWVCLSLKYAQKLFATENLTTHKLQLIGIIITQFASHYASSPVLKNLELQEFLNNTFLFQVVL